MHPPPAAPPLSQPWRDLPLRSNEIRVFSLWLDLSPARVASLAARLSLDERSRADRFHFEQHRHRFVVGRGLLRGLLAACLGLDPQEVRFVYGRFGKPALAPDLAHRLPVSFNLAHSGPAGICALALDRDVGVDVEEIRPLREQDAIARRVFAPAEVRSLEERDESERLRWFFRIWARREALLKARGDGLGGSQRSFDVSAIADGAGGDVSEEGSGETMAWSLRDLTAPPGFTAAVAVRGSLGEIVECGDPEHLGDSRDMG
jgi:4'-phosphopantetheinyl transferase